MLAEQPSRPPSRGRLGWLLSLARSLGRSAFHPTPAGAAPRRLDVSAFGWSRMKGADTIALETWWDRDLPVFRRSRETFRALLRDAVPLLLRLGREGPAVSRQWREAFPRLRSVAFWRGYLGLAPTRPEG